MNKRINLQIDNLRPSQSLIEKPYCFFSCMAVPPLHGCPGEFVGVLAVITGEPSFFNVKATKQCHVVIISKANFYK